MNGVALQGAVLAGIATLGTVGLLFPSSVPPLPEPRSAAAVTVMVAGLALFALLALRALDTFLLTLRANDYLVVLGLLFLGTSLVGALMFDGGGLVARPRLRARRPGPGGGSVAVDLRRAK